MTTILDQINTAAELEKKAYFEYVKGFSSSGISALAKGGMKVEDAIGVVKEACEKDSGAYKLKGTAALLEKAAAYINDLEVELSGLRKEASISESEPLNRLASMGFSPEEIAHMSSLPENLITKVASAQDKPWEMGGGSGFAREKTDPFLEFLLTPTKGL